VVLSGSAPAVRPARPALDFANQAGKQSRRHMPPKRRAPTNDRKEMRELDVAIGFMEGIVRRDDRFVEALQILGDHYTRRGKFEAGLKVDERLSQLEPGDPLVFYNLACSYSLTDRVDLAVAALERAMALGYRDFRWLARDPDLRKLRRHPLYQHIKDKIRKLKVT
jgi:hypothetical protein